MSRSSLDLNMLAEDGSMTDQGKNMPSQNSALKGQNIIVHEDAESTTGHSSPRLQARDGPHGFSTWDLVENETPPYSADQQSAECQHRNERDMAPSLPQIDVDAVIDPVVNGERHALQRNAGPIDTVDRDGNPVRTYDCRQVAFAPFPSTPARAPRNAGTPMVDVRRRPTPFPLRHVLGQNTFIDQELRPAVVFPAVPVSPAQPALRGPSHFGRQSHYEQRHDHYWQQRHDPFHGPRRRESQQFRNFARDPTTRFPAHPPAAAYNSFVIQARERHDLPGSFVDHYGTPWRPYRAYDHQDPHGMESLLRPCHPPVEAREDGSGGHSGGSMIQNRPADHESPRFQQVAPLRGGHGYLNAEQDVDVEEYWARPTVILERAGVNSAPLYGTSFLRKDGGQEFRGTDRFSSWQKEASRPRTRDDFLLTPASLSSPQASVASTGCPATAAPKGTFANPLAANPVELPSSTTATGHSVSATRTPKRSASGSTPAVDEEELRPAKRSRLVSNMRRLSLSTGTEKSSVPCPGLIAAKKQRTGSINIFGRRSISRGLSLSRVSSHGPKRVRLAIVGDTNAGKTTMLNRLYTGTYQPAEKSEHLRNNDFNMTIGGNSIILEAWDIPGSAVADDRHPLLHSFFDAVLICFSVEDVANVDRAPQWVDVLQACLVVDVPIYLAGLKSDSRPSFPTLRLRFTNEPVPTTREQCLLAAQNISSEDYFECSAKTGDGVQTMFNTIVFQVAAKKDEDWAKMASRARRERLRRGVYGTQRRISQLFCMTPGLGV